MLFYINSSYIYGGKKIYSFDNIFVIYDSLGVELSAKRSKRIYFSPS